MAARAVGAAFRAISAFSTDSDRAMVVHLAGEGGRFVAGPSIAFDGGFDA